MKLSTLRIALIKQTIVVVIIIALVSAPVFYADYKNEDYNKQNQELQAQTDLIVKDAAELLSQYSNATSNLDFYNEIEKKKKENILSVNKIILRDAVFNIRKKYNFGVFDVVMSDIKPSENATYKLSNVFVEYSTVNIKFSATTDIDVFSMMQELQKSFSSIKFNSMKMNISKDFSDAALFDIKNSCFSPLVNGELSFIWSGLQNVKTDGVNSLIGKPK